MASERRIAQVSLVVRDYDEAIQFYTQKLNFKVLEDTRLTESKRWVLIAPEDTTNCSLLLAKASDENQLMSVGNQTGGRVFLFLFTDDFYRDYHQMKEKGVHFLRPPKEESYGTVAVFEDLYGNLWDLLQASDAHR